MALFTSRTKCPPCCGGGTCTETNQLCTNLPTYEELYEFYKNCGGGAIYGDDVNNSPVKGRFYKQEACLRFYYRAVNEDLAGGTVFCEGPIGPVGVRGGKEVLEIVRGYRNDKPALFNGEYCGLYIYPIRFYSWNSGCTYDPFWITQGGAQWANPEKTICNRIYIYNVDMFSLCV